MGSVDGLKQEYAYAIKLLSRKNFFEAELINALKKKFGTKDFSDIIISLKNDKFIDDDRYFEDFVRWRIESGYGPYYIQQKLRLKGVFKDVYLIRDVIMKLDIDTNMIIKESISKYIRTRGKRKENFMKSCLNWLMGRGFSSEDCIKILRQEVREDESNFFEGC